MAHLRNKKRVLPPDLRAGAPLSFGTPVAMGWFSLGVAEWQSDVYVPEVEPHRLQVGAYPFIDQGVGHICAYLKTPEETVQTQKWMQGVSAFFAAVSSRPRTADN